MRNGKDWDPWMLLFHQLDVMKNIRDVVVERLNVAPNPIAQTMSNCKAKNKTGAINNGWTFNSETFPNLRWS